MLYELGYLAIEQDLCNHEIQYFVGPDHIACNTCNRYSHNVLFVGKYSILMALYNFCPVGPFEHAYFYPR